MGNKYRKTWKYKINIFIGGKKREIAENIPCTYFCEFCCQDLVPFNKLQAIKKKGGGGLILL